MKLRRLFISLLPRQIKILIREDLMINYTNYLKITNKLPHKVTMRFIRQIWRRKMPSTFYHWAKSASPNLKKQKNMKIFLIYLPIILWLKENIYNIVLNMKFINIKNGLKSQFVWQSLQEIINKMEDIWRIFNQYCNKTIQIIILYTLMTILMMARWN